MIIEDAERLNNEDVKQIVDHADKHIQSVIFCVGDLYSETPVYKFFQRSKNLLGLCMESDYRENKYIPEFVLQQAELMKRRIPKAYYPIWLGVPYESEENKQ